jgi:hypothetical protein
MSPHINWFHHCLHHWQFHHLHCNISSSPVPALCYLGTFIKTNGFWPWNVCFFHTPVILGQICCSSWLLTQLLWQHNAIQMSTYIWIASACYKLAVFKIFDICVLYTESRQTFVSKLWIIEKEWSLQVNAIY